MKSPLTLMDVEPFKKEELDITRLVNILNRLGFFCVINIDQY